MTVTIAFRDGSIRRVEHVNTCYPVTNASMSVVEYVIEADSRTLQIRVPAQSVNCVECSGVAKL